VLPELALGASFEEVLGLPLEELLELFWLLAPLFESVD
jgi:hypothetical protein